MKERDSEVRRREIVKNDSAVKNIKLHLVVLNLKYNQIYNILLNYW